jgi:hypothetical protein
MDRVSKGIQAIPSGEERKSDDDGDKVKSNKLKFKICATKGWTIEC